MARGNKLSYIAGIIDGEGCLSIHKTKHKNRKGFGLSYQIVVSVEMCSKKIINILFNEFGGSMGTRIRDKKWKRTYSWRISSNKAKEFLIMILPYLIEKKPQAELLIECQENVISVWKGYRFNQQDVSIREKYYLKNKLLNQRGE